MLPHHPPPCFPPRCFISSLPLLPDATASPTCPFAPSSLISWQSSTSSQLQILPIRSCMVDESPVSYAPLPRKSITRTPSPDSPVSSAPSSCIPRGDNIVARLDVLHCASSTASARPPAQNQSISETTFGRMSDLIGSFTICPKSAEPRESLQRQTSGADVRSRGSEATSNAPPIRKNASMSSEMSDVSLQCSAHSVSARRTSSWCFDEKVLIQSLYKLLSSPSPSSCRPTAVGHRIRRLPSLPVVSLCSASFRYVVLLNTGSTGTT